MAVTHYSQKRRAERIDHQLRNGVPTVNSLAIPKGKSESQTAKICDDRLRHLANHSVERGLLMHIMKSPAKTGRPMFQYIDGMTDESTTFADYVQSIVGLSRTQAKDDIINALTWSGIHEHGEIIGIETVAEISATVPPNASHLKEFARLAMIKTEKVPDAEGKNNTMPVGTKNWKLLKSAWDFVQSSYKQAVESTPPDEDPPKLNTTFIRKRLAKGDGKGSFYGRAGVKAPTAQKPKGRIGWVCAAAEKLTSILDTFEEYENGIADVISEDEWSKTQCIAARERLEFCRDAIEVALAEL